MSSITAALQPAETDYYYYVLGADGKHVFSETLSEHQQNVAAASAAAEIDPGRRHDGETKQAGASLPAGDFERLRMAVLYGADAVYLAGTSFGMRAFAGNFSPEELPKAVAFAHSHGVRVHATVNTMPRNSEADALPAYLEQLQDAGWTPSSWGTWEPSPWRGGMLPGASAMSAPRPA